MALVLASLVSMCWEAVLKHLHCLLLKCRGGAKLKFGILGDFNLVQMQESVQDNLADPTESNNSLDFS